MKNTSETSESSLDATKLSSVKPEGDKLSPSRAFLACVKSDPPQTDVNSDGSEICDSLAAAKEAIYPVAAACVVLLTLLGVCYSLYFTKAVMLPIVGAFLLNFLFSPIVLKMNRMRIPNVLGTFIVLGIAIGAIVIALAFAYEPATTWLADKDRNLAIVKQKLIVLQQPIKAIKEVTEQIDEISSGKTVEQVAPPDEKSAEGKSAEEISNDGRGGNDDSKDERVDGNEKKSHLESKDSDKSDESERVSLGDAEAGSSNPLLKSQRQFASKGASSDSTGPVPDKIQGAGSEGDNTKSSDQVEVVAEPIAPVVPVEIKQPSISNRIFSTTGDAFAGISLMLVLLFYLLSAGDRGLEKLVKLMPTFRDKKRVVALSRAIERSVSDYLLTTTLINFGLGIIIGAGMWVIGMPNPILWGVMAMFLNYFPFVGAIIGAAIVFLAAIVSFDSIAYSVWAPSIYLFANLIEANFITPILLGRSVSLHPVWLMIFFVIVAWVWGLGGAIVAVPVLAVIKITCDHVEPLMPVGEFLGR